MTAEELNPAITARWTSLRLAATIEASPGSTIVPPTVDPTSAGKRALARLAVGSSTGVELEGTLGEGGMGIVRLGTQTSLGRKVAVKTLRADHREPSAVLKLMREAWITGSLEHPNIMPIHDVRLSEEGKPLVVLKRIEGIDWCDVIHDADAVAERFSAGDLLEHNLGILMQVCRAVAFAHNRGVVHRDIKPENVRIGAFGEVYLLDWGIAVALADDGSGRFALASEAVDMAGTPTYMAPEMLGEGDGPGIGVATDVYLLGATLYEVVAGHPPHRGSTALAIVSSVMKSEPALPADAPEELAAIVRRCMRRDPAERFGSAEEVRLAIERFLRHRGALALVARADERRAALERVLAGAGGDSERRVVAYDLFGECRFGYQQALADWSDNQAACEGLQKALLAMIDFELSRGDARAARRLEEELQQVPPSVRMRIERGLDRQEAEEQRLAALDRLERDLDPKVGTRTRMFTGGLIATLWGVVPLVLERSFDPGARASHAANLTMSGATLVVGLALFVWARDSLTKTAFNRRLSACMGLLLLSQLLLTLGAMMLGLASEMVDVLFFFLWFLAAAYMTVAVEPRLVVAACVHLAGFFLAARYLDQRSYIMAAANFAAAANLVAIWRPERLFEPRDKLSTG